MTKKEKYKIYYVDGNQYYTTDKSLFDMKNKFAHWENICGLGILIFIVGFLIGIYPMYCIDNNTWNTAATILAIFSIIIAVGGIVFENIAKNKKCKYEGYTVKFCATKEFERQQKRFEKIEQQKEKQAREKKAKALIAVYDALNSTLAETEKVDIIQKYMKKD